MLDAEWLAGCIDELTDEVVDISPSEWAEENRRLPDGQPMPGPYDYAVTPYLREIVDCMDRRSPVREIAIMKGVQIGCTVGIAENFIGYAIGHLKTWPMMLVTANMELAKIRMDEYLVPMIEQSGLLPSVQNNSDNKRKAAQTAHKISCLGGGFLVVTSANNPANLRSVSAKAVVMDEMDAYLLRVGRDGSPGALIKNRTSAYELSRKVLMISTPTTTHESVINAEFKNGDQREYRVPCLGCGEMDPIKWRWDDKNGVKKGGIVWTTTPDGNVEPGSVRYACRHCGFCHLNSHKHEMLARGEWVATDVPAYPGFRSYHIPALLSPPSFYSWEHAVRDWTEAWDCETNKSKDDELLQSFYNNVLGVPFSTTSTRLTLSKVARHVQDYQSGTVPNHLAVTMCGGKIGFLTCAADIHKDFISAAVYAWGPSRVGFLVSVHTFKGPTTDPFDTDGPWSKLKALIETKVPDNDGREYEVKITLVDSQYNNAEVYAFCGQFPSGGVFPIAGAAGLKSGAKREFQRMKSASADGLDAWTIRVDHYKARLATVLKTHPRPTTEPSLVDSVSFPTDIDEIAPTALKELTAEEWREKKDAKGVGGKWEWKRVAPRNEMWDLAVYNSAARDIAGFMICREHFELDLVNWGELWPYLEDHRFAWAEVAPVAPPPVDGV